MIEHMFGIFWAHVRYWWMIAGLVVVLMSATWYVYYRRNQLARILDSAGTQLKHFSARKNYIKTGLALVALTCIFLALLHPQWGRVTDRVEQRGRDLMIALDISRSMLTKDVSPDRLSCAKKIISQLINALESDRVALMVFSEKARVYCPLTQDRELISLFLDQIDYATMSAGTTRLDQAVLCALDQCARQPQRKQKVLVIVSDGEDFSGSLAGIKERAAACGLTILVIGIGTTQGAPVPIYNERGERTGYLKDTRDRVVISQLNKPALHSLAQGTGGLALFVEKDTVSLNDLIARIKQFEKERQEAAQVHVLQEQYSWFLLVAFICVLLEWVL